ncbi:MAG TPA: hypothetical protein VLF39_02570 [Candidatus Saccharimonadales bacterium]|nr:hypothetical protein [Candidatus Saccharimonadales bacterium]
MKVATKLNISAWLLSLITVGVAVVAWGQSLLWNYKLLSIFTIFPLLGLTAFSLMWCHYIVAASRQLLGVEKSAVHKYFEVTSLIVLLLILLHPGLLWYQLWRSGFGLPPESYLYHYVAPSLRWAAILGTLSWFVFLAYEFRRKYEKTTWWPYIAYSSDVAMVAILIHSLKLGTQLNSTWLRQVWYFYGVTFAGCLAYKYTRKQQIV